MTPAMYQSPHQQSVFSQPPSFPSVNNNDPSSPISSGYIPPTFKTFAQRKAEKERILAIQAGKDPDAPSLERRGGVVVNSSSSSGEDGRGVLRESRSQEGILYSGSQAGSFTTSPSPSPPSIPPSPGPNSFNQISHTTSLQSIGSNNNRQSLPSNFIPPNPPPSPHQHQHQQTQQHPSQQQPSHQLRHHHSMSLGGLAMALPPVGIPLSPENTNSLPSRSPTPGVGMGGSARRPLPAPVIRGGSPAGGPSQSPQPLLPTTSAAATSTLPPISPHRGWTPGPSYIPSDIPTSPHPFPYVQQHGSSSSNAVLPPTRSQTLPTPLSAAVIPAIIQQPQPAAGPSTSRRPLPKPLSNKSSLVFPPTSSNSEPTIPTSSSVGHLPPSISAPSSQPSTPNPYQHHHSYQPPSTPTSNSIPTATDYSPSFDPSNPNRSDKLTSIQSLDRHAVAVGRNGTRRLPKPPGGLGTGSLGSLEDRRSRGDLSGGGEFGTILEQVRRESPPTIVEVEGRAGNVATPPPTSSVHVRAPAQIEVRDPPEVTTTPAMVIPTISFPGMDDEEEDYTNGPQITVSSSSSGPQPPPRSPSPALTFSRTPLIRTSSHDGPAKPSIPSINIGEPTISISVPTFSFPDQDEEEDKQSSSNIQINVPTSQPSVPASRNNIPANITRGAITCAGCEEAIIGRIVSAMERRWHPNCFRCSTCSILLEMVSSYEHDGKAYCHLDYHDVSIPERALDEDLVMYLKLTFPLHNPTAIRTEMLSLRNGYR